MSKLLRVRLHADPRDHVRYETRLGYAVMVTIFLLGVAVGAFVVTVLDAGFA